MSSNELDRKSSRGMIYENEELRLRTININAEVERGQSDIKKLRRENYQLRREIWTLRDEYDRLGKLLKNKCGPTDSTNSTSDCSCDCGGVAGECKHAGENGEGGRCYSCYLDDDSLCCDMCNETEQFNKNIEERTPTKSINADKSSGYGTISATKSNQAAMPKPVRNEKIDMNFDDLSVVSEECLSNSDDQLNDKATTATKGDAIEDVAESMYSNFQSTIPPLQHFENLSYKDIGPNLDTLSDIQFNGEMYQASEPTPPPPTPPPLPAANRKNSSLPLPPPPTLNEDGTIAQDNTNGSESSTIEKPKYFFSPLKSKRKSSNDGKGEMRPDVLLVNNVVASDSGRLATIRKPHNPLKYPSNTNAASIDPEMTGDLDGILHDIQGLSKGIETMQVQKTATYENVKEAKCSTSPESDQSHPYRTEMSLVLSYNGNKSTYTTNQNADKKHESDVETPPPNLPHAMKLLPNKLTYTGNNERFKPYNVPIPEHTNENTDNSANEKIATQAIESTSSDEKSGNSRKHEISTKNDDKHDTKSHRDGGNVTIKTDDDDESQSNGKTKDTNDSHDSKDGDDRSKSSVSEHGHTKDGKSRRVSIHFNGIPVTIEPDSEPHSNNDSDVNTTAEMVAEELVSAAISCRRASRRFSCSRKMSDESIGSFLYPPNPFGFVGGGGKKMGGRKMSFLSRRHSDGLIPGVHGQYHMDYDTGRKSNSRYHCRTHMHHNHHLNPDHLCTNLGTSIGESTATSINSIGSSRESLASESQRSRKISISSHSKNGGKIPWCACWGNGCL